MLTGILVTAPILVYADDTETSTDQSARQKNTGSGDSANFNCAENLIRAGVDENDCEFGNGGGSDGGEQTLFCHNPADGPANTLPLPQQAIDAQQTQQANGVPGHEDDHEGACFPGET